MRDTLSSIVRAIANGDVRRFLEDQEADSQVSQAVSCPSRRRTGAAHPSRDASFSQGLCCSVP